LTEQLVAFDSIFSAVLPGAGGGSNAQAVSAEVGELLYQVNERAAAATGADIFKLTNKSTLALKRLGDNCESPQRLSELVDDLYFLVYEGSGACKRLPSPPPAFAMDVKVLRTQFRHDLDHGDAVEASRKRQRAGAMVQKYCGVPTPCAATPVQCGAAQLRLLSELRKMLRRLAKSAA
jgi:hypothetical protein